MPQSPLALSNEEYEAIQTAAAPVHPHQRDGFLQALADELQRVPVRGVGLIHRIAAETQRRFTIDARRDAESAAAPRHKGAAA
jgi:hypothetical protein